MNVYLGGSRNNVSHLRNMKAWMNRELEDRNAPIQVQADWIDQWETNVKLYPNRIDVVSLDLNCIDRCQGLLATYPFGYGTISEMVYFLTKHEEDQLPVAFFCPAEMKREDLPWPALNFVKKSTNSYAKVEMLRTDRSKRFRHGVIVNSLTDAMGFFTHWAMTHVGAL